LFDDTAAPSEENRKTYGTIRPRAVHHRASAEDRIVRARRTAVLHVRPFLSVTTGIVVLFVGKTLNQRFALLREYNIPEPVTAGCSSRSRALRGVCLLPGSATRLRRGGGTAGFIGFALGATPTAMVNMTAVTQG
jgi:hypothetical protein